MIDKELLEAARREDWEYVDERIPEISTDPKYIRWAHAQLIHSPDGNVRDLGGSILEKANVSKEEFERDIKYKLLPMMRKDENPYARFRAAFAIVNHDAVGEDKKEIGKVLLEAKKDKDISEIAGEYLKRLNHD